MGVLDGKVVIVTGAARGLGRAMSAGLVAAGARVVGADLPDGGALDKAARELGPAFLPVEADVTDEQACRRVVDEADRAFGGAGALINNAGIGMGGINRHFAASPTRFWEVTPEQWREVLEINATSQFLMARALVPALIARKWGRIVNVTTSYPTMVMTGFTPYGPSKATVEASTAIWSKDLAGSGVTVNALLPGGPANTSMVTDDRAWPDRAKLVQPQAMVAPVVWLVSGASDGVTGRRFNASLWNEANGAATAAMLASAPAAW